MLVLIPCTGLSNPSDTTKVKKKTLKPTMFKNNGKTYFAFDAEQSKFLYKTIKLNQINQYNLKLKDTIIYNNTKQINNLMMANNILSKGIDTCNTLNTRLGIGINERDSKIKKLDKKINRKNTFIVGSLAVNISLITFLLIKGL